MRKLSPALLLTFLLFVASCTSYYTQQEVVPVLTDILKEVRLTPQPVYEDSLVTYLNSWQADIYYENYELDKERFKQSVEHLLGMEYGKDSLFAAIQRYALAKSVAEVRYAWEWQMEPKPVEIVAFDGYYAFEGLQADAPQTIFANNTDFNLYLLKLNADYSFDTLVAGGDAMGIVDAEINSDEYDYSFMVYPKRVCANYGSGFYALAAGSGGEFRLSPYIYQSRQTASIALVVPTTTWHAYNDWAGKSLYRNGVDSADVWFQRTTKPLNEKAIRWEEDAEMGHDIFALANAYKWFQQFGEVVAYPDYYLEQYPEYFEQTKSIVLAQHCEYFSMPMYLNLKSMVEQEGKNLLSIGANQIYWAIRWHDDFEQIECRKGESCYSGSIVPGGKWRSNHSGEAQFLGVMYSDAGASTYAPYEVTNAEHWLYEGLHVRQGQRFGEKGLDGRGLSGNETDKSNYLSPSDVEIIAVGTNPEEGGAHMVLRDFNTHGIFSSGSISSIAGLGVDSTFSGIVRNFMLHYHKN